MALTVKRVLGTKCQKQVKRIYLDAFSRGDRMPFFMMYFMSLLPSTKFRAHYDGDILCGFLYYAVIGRQIFVMFFAVDAALRENGYGSQILENLKLKNPNKKIIVSIEPCLDNEPDDINSRRKAFYQRNGFSETGYMMKLGKVQELLIANGKFSKISFQLFLALYSLFTLWPKIWKK